MKTKFDKFLTEIINKFPTFEFYIDDSFNDEIQRISIPYGKFDYLLTIGKYLDEIHSRKSYYVLITSLKHNGQQNADYVTKKFVLNTLRNLILFGY